MTDFDLRNSIKVEDEKIVVCQTQDVEPYIEYCKALRNNEPGKFEKKGDMRLMASVPITIYKQMLQKLGIPLGRMYKLTADEKKRLHRLIQSPEYAYFRTSSAKF